MGVGSPCSVSYWGVSHGSVHRILASAQVGSGILHAGIAKTGVLLGFKSQTRQARVTCVPINIRRCWRSIRTGWRWHCRIQGGIAQVVQVIQAVEAGARDPGDCRRYHAWRHTHGGDGVWRGEHALRRQRVDIHGVEERKAFGGEGSGGQALSCPVVVGVAGVHIIVGLHEAVKLWTEAVFAKLGLLVPFSLSPFGSAVLEPNLQKREERERCETRVSQEPPLQPFATSRGNKLTCPYIHTFINVYVHTYTYICLPPSLRSPALGRGSDVLPRPRSIPQALVLPSLAWQIRGRSIPLLASLQHNLRCSNSHHRGQSFLFNFFFFFFISASFSLFFPSFLGLFRAEALQGKYNSAKERAKRLETSGILRRCFLLRERRGKPETNKSLLQFVKATSSSCAKASRAENHFLNKLVRLLFGEEKKEK